MKNNEKYIRITIEEIREQLLEKEFEMYYHHIYNHRDYDMVKDLLKEGFKGYDNYENDELIKEYEIKFDKKVILTYPSIDAIRPTVEDLKQLRDDLMTEFNCKLNNQKTRDKIMKYSSKWCKERRLGLRPFQCNLENNLPEVIDNNCVVLNLCEPVEPDHSHKFYTLIVGNNTDFYKGFSDDKIIIVK